MHSKRASKHVRRITPYLMTVGLGLAVAANAAEPESLDDETVEIPAPTIDTDGDGLMDAWDRSGNGQADAWDKDGDGQPDLLDDDGDGQPD
ncbi:hypothetical protein [Parasphingorhabdus sp.]|uniref:hypothetical protein n=1 Tax=Parasphingorhabdus sp. TaxID=2709688 RepID=UPI003A952B31